MADAPKPDGQDPNAPKRETLRISLPPRPLKPASARITPAPRPNISGASTIPMHTTSDLEPAPTSSAPPAWSTAVTKPMPSIAKSAPPAQTPPTKPAAPPLTGAPPGSKTTPLFPAKPPSQSLQVPPPAKPAAAATPTAPPPLPTPPPPAATPPPPPAGQTGATAIDDLKTPSGRLIVPPPRVML